MGGGDPYHLHTPLSARLDPRKGILDDNAPDGMKSEKGGTLQEDLRIGFAVGDVIAADHGVEKFPEAGGGKEGLEIGPGRA